MEGVGPIGPSMETATVSSAYRAILRSTWGGRYIPTPHWGFSSKGWSQHLNQVVWVQGSTVPAHPG